MSSREQLPLIRNVTRNVLAWFKKIRRTNPLVSHSRRSYNSELSLLHVALILNREGRCCDSYEGRCDCGVNIDSCHSRVGNHGEGICQRGVGRDSDRASMNISIRVKLRSPG